MRKIEASAFRRMPWKNGGGETAEIAVAPLGATADGFDWRVSTARVAAPGPFSHFQGIDRSLVVVSGQGLRLVTSPPGGNEVAQLDPTSAPFRFAGDIPARAELVDGEPVVDFNVMTRRDTHTHALLRVTVHGVEVVEGDAVVFYCLKGSAECITEGTAITLTVGDALVAGDGQKPDPTSVRIEIRSTNACELLAAQMFRRSQSHV